MEFHPRLDYERFEICFHAIDSHTCGEFTRVVVSGFPQPMGETMLERKSYASEHFDHFRRALMLEPRGHHDMFGAFITEPINKAADFGLIYMDIGNFQNMCGHATIGTATVAVEAGLVKVTEPYTDVKMDVPAGLITARVKVEKGRAQEVTITNVPAFLYLENQTVEIDGKTIEYDVSFGGSFFALIDADKLGIPINAHTLPTLRALTVGILKKINECVSVQHPCLTINKVDRCEFYCRPVHPEATLRNVVMNPEGMADRSPCGTGTSAKLAALYAKGQLGIGEPFIHESFMGTLFRGIAIEETSVGSYRAVIPQITGSAHITGEAVYLIDSDDPLKYGFPRGLRAYMRLENIELTGYVVITGILNHYERLLKMSLNDFLGFYISFSNSV